MLESLIFALEEWPTDNESETLPSTPELASVLKALDTKSELILSYIPKLENENAEYEGLYDIAYSDSHFISGFGRIIKSEKVAHLGMLLELITEAGRELQTYSEHSMLYLFDLLIKKLKSILKEHSSNRSTKIEVSDVVTECTIYLAEPVSTLLEKQEKTRQEIITNKEIEAPNKAIVSKVEITPHPEDQQANIAEEDEILNIPADKLGLISDFCEEAWESLQTSENLLIELENNPNSTELINELFRAVHTVKGGSRLIEIRKIEALSHELETVLDNVRAGNLSLTSNLIDLALNCIKRITLITNEVAGRGPVTTPVNDLVSQLKNDPLGTKSIISTATLSSKLETRSDSEFLETLEPINLQNTPKVKTVVREDSIKVSAEKLDSVLNTSSEVYITRIKLDNDQRLLTEALSKVEVDITSMAKTINDLKLHSQLDHAQLLRRNAEVSDQKLNYGIGKHIEEISEGLTRQHDNLAVNAERLSIHNRNVKKNIEDLEVLSSRLQSGAMNFRMVPIANLFNRFPAQVRDIARQIGKRVDLKIIGSDTELDKILINQLADPLLHLVRNSIDHGIESPDQRSSKQKSDIGEIKLRAYYMGSNAIIEIEDDGKGIDPQIILSKAVEKGIISKEQSTELNEKEIFDFIFEPGFSSAEQVTELSGRGVGMDVVKTSINQMQGSIKIDSKINLGTKITLRLPLTLAVVSILLVAENGYEFGFPILNVEEIINVKLTQDVKKVNDTLVYNFRSELVPVNFLSDFLEYPKNAQSTGENFILILNDGERKIGVIVDEVLGQQSVLLKQLGSLIEKAPFVIGCTILSNSKLVLILNVLELASFHANYETTSFYEKIEKVDQIQNKRQTKTILVVDDSRIQRKRICEFLQQSGYRTEEAVDGYDALNMCKKFEFNSFCVDIQMPLMDGYELIKNLRDLKEYRFTYICVISGVHMDKDNVTARLRDLEVHGFYEKPVDLDDLIAELDDKLIGEENSLVEEVLT